MDREILFRGKRVDTREWIIGFYCPKPFLRFPCSPTIFPAKTIDISWSGFEVDPETVGQFTGLTDKNRKKIFEGDIVEFNAYGFHYVGVVIIEDGNTSIRCDNPPAEPFADDVIKKRNGVVIGNIHDNPELLTKT